MPKLSELLAETAETEVQIGKTTLHVRYRPCAYTGKFIDRLGERTLYEVLPEIVESWDLEGEDGKAIPVEKEALETADVPLAALQLVYERVREVLLPNLRKPASSA